EVIALPGYGDRLRIQADEDHYLNVSFPQDENRVEGAEGEGIGEDGSGLPLDEGETMLSEDDPFLESDLPLASLAEEDDLDPGAE
ncbi:MAG: hypothetical protein J6Y48_02135, partial [Clostridia bacterium]|nr:hypothetical protein [Clostridia bacterium]